MVGSVCKIYRAVEGVRSDTMLGQSVRTGASNRLNGLYVSVTSPPMAVVSHTTAISIIAKC